MTTQTTEDEPQSESHKKDDGALGEVVVLREQNATLAAEIAALKGELSKTLTDTQKSTEASLRRALELKEAEFNKTLGETKASYEQQISALTQRSTQALSRVQELSIVAKVASGPVRFKADALDLVTEKVKKDVRVNPDTLEIEISVDGISSLEQYLEKLAEDKPSLVESKAKGGAGIPAQSFTGSGTRTVTQLPANYAAMTQSERVKLLRANPELREALKQQG